MGCAFLSLAIRSSLDCPPMVTLVLTEAEILEGRPARASCRSVRVAMAAGRYCGGRRSSFRWSSSVASLTTSAN